MRSAGSFSGELLQRVFTATAREKAPRPSQTVSQPVPPILSWPLSDVRGAHSVAPHTEHYSEPLRLSRPAMYALLCSLPCSASPTFRCANRLAILTGSSTPQMFPRRASLRRVVRMDARSAKRRSVWFALATAIRDSRSRDTQKNTFPFRVSYQSPVASHQAQRWDHHRGYALPQRRPEKKNVQSRVRLKSELFHAGAAD